MALAPIPKKRNDDVFRLIGMRGALYQLFIEALAIDNVIVKEAAVTFIHQRNIEKYEPAQLREPFPTAPQGWEYTGSLNGKGMLTPVFGEAEPAEEVTVFVHYEGQWFPYVLRTDCPGMKYGTKIVELFGVTHTTWSDIHAMNAQSLVTTELIDSAEVVLRVPEAVVDYILTHK
jgi:hypothetical protein